MPHSFQRASHAANARIKQKAKYFISCDNYIPDDNLIKPLVKQDYNLEKYAPARCSTAQLLFAENYELRHDFLFLG
jgi:hypothetical protein